MSIAKNTLQSLQYLRPESQERKKTQKKQFEQRSPYNDNEYYRRRCNELEVQLGMQETQNTQEAEEPIDRDKLLRRYQQKKTEAELWKQKYENQISQMVQLKSNYEIEIKQLQKEINCLLDRLDMKPKKVHENLNHKLRKIQKEDEQEINKLLEDNQNLRQAVQQQQDLLEVRNEEIQRLLSANLQLNNQLNYKYQENQKYIQDMKLVSREDLESLEFHLNEIHQKEINRIAFKFEAQIKEIEKENNRYRDIIEDYKKQIFEVEGVKKDLEAKKLKILELETDKSRMGFEKEERVRVIQKELENFNEKFQEFDQEIQNKKEEIQFYKDQIIQQNDLMKQQKMEIEQLKLRIYELELSKNKVIEEGRKEMQQNDATKTERIFQLSNQIESYQIEIKRLKGLLDGKAEEIDNLLLQQNVLERENCKLRDEIDQTKSDLINQERQYIQQMDDLRSNFDQLSATQIDSAKRQFNQQIILLTQENKELRYLLDKRCKDQLEINKSIITEQLSQLR